MGNKVFVEERDVFGDLKTYREYILTDERIMIFKKNLLKASNYIYELVKYCDFLLKINGKVNDDRKENCSEK